MDSFSSMTAFSQGATEWSSAKSVQASGTQVGFSAVRGKVNIEGKGSFSLSLSLLSLCLWNCRKYSDQVSPETEFQS